MSWEFQGFVTEGIDDRAQCPVVDIDNDNFWRIYFSHRDDNNHSHTSYVDVEPGNPFKVYKVSEYPVLSPGPVGSVDTAGAMASSIITINEQKHMYYVGWTQRVDVPYFNTTCLAITADGDNWVKVGPILSPTIHDSGYSGTFYPIANQTNTVYTGLYLSCFDWVKGKHSKVATKISPSTGDWDPIYNLRRAVSADGITWRKDEVAIDLTGNQGGASQASIYYNKMQGVYQTWYSVRDKKDFRNNPDHAYRIAYAESQDLVTWKVIEDSPYEIHASRKLYNWDSVMCCYPCVIEYEGTLYMFYNGDGFGATGIGYSIWI